MYIYLSYSYSWQGSQSWFRLKLSLTMTTCVSETKYLICWWFDVGSSSPLQSAGAAPSVPGAVGGEDPGVARGAPGHAQVSLRSGCFRISYFKQDITSSA